MSSPKKQKFVIFFIRVNFLRDYNFYLHERFQILILKTMTLY